MLDINFLITILCLLFIIELIHYKEGYGIYLYYSSDNKIMDSENNPIKSSSLFPNIDKKTNSELISMFTDISYCDNIDDISYSYYKDKYILQDQMNMYKEGFSGGYDHYEKIYLFFVGLLFIYLLLIMD